MNAYVREPVNAFTHLGGAVLSFVALLAMLVKVSVKMPSVSTISAVILFGVGMMILYAASSVYHSVVASERVIYFFRKLDHSMIFLLIAGTYAPFCLITLQAANGLLLFVLVYATAICGIVFKMFWFNCPRWLSTAIYLMMGWLIVLFFAPLSENLSIEGILFLVLGGVFYTIGGFIYGAKPKWLEFKYIGHHEIFHIFVLLGSLAHFLCVYCYVI
ncbi:MULTISPECIES: PAQR family membrane homeostasis protein TrhA [Bacillus]|uniref:Hemolysin n=1 Tax=Bacillus pseudomycoides TaxID=64104 RepID=A0A1Y3MED4_9BACI|nr:MULTISPECIES: hemolysin III family protein [Bacillus cereus group]EOP62304.1 hemolysin III family channel protein [Bacillus cereus VD136]EOP77159.1 hemolysin III family channel protein [Bacillus cereus VDM006]EOQ18836.1 hemolysin III family channel protein [Bacillus cereus VDM021]OUM48805.1 hemolysin [Bacillus pseudomycoides]PEE38442.1 hemolysin [Bacillus pseudomycoides]